MSSAVSYSRQAVRDLDHVWEEVYLASGSYETAAGYVEQLINKVGSKADFSRSGSPLYYADSFTGYYYVVFKAYLAFYHVKNNDIFIDRILHRKSNDMRVLRLNSVCDPENGG